MTAYDLAVAWDKLQAKAMRHRRRACDAWTPESGYSPLVHTELDAAQRCDRARDRLAAKLKKMEVPE